MFYRIVFATHNTHSTISYPKTCQFLEDRVLGLRSSISRVCVFVTTVVVDFSTGLTPRGDLGCCIRSSQSINNRITFIVSQRLEFSQIKHMEIGGDKTFLLLCTSDKIFDTESNASKSSTTVCLNFSKRRFRAEQGKSKEDFKKLTHSYVTSRPYFATSQLSNVLVFPVFPLKFSTLIATNWSN